VVCCLRMINSSFCESFTQTAWLTVFARLMDSIGQRRMKSANVAHLWLRLCQSAEERQKSQYENWRWHSTNRSVCTCSLLNHDTALAVITAAAQKLLRVVSSTKWGADEKTLLHLYRALIRSKLDYDSVVYGSARKSYLDMLELIQNHALCLCLGAFRTSPVESKWDTCGIEVEKPCCSVLFESERWHF